MNESENQFSFTRAALSTGRYAKKQIPISQFTIGHHQTNIMKFIQTWLFVFLISFTARAGVTPPTLQAVEETNGIFTFIWSAVPQQTYLIQFKTNILQTNWNIVGGAIKSANTIATGVDTLASGSPGRFYRLWLLQTNVSDVTKPTLTITAPTAGQKWSNSTFVVTGTANDNKQVAAAFFQLNSNSWATATTTNKWTNWNSSLLPLPGTNTVAAYTVDTSGNYSATSRVSFIYVVSGILQVRMTGLGTFSPNYSNAVLQLGKSYTMTATAAGGFAFTNWVISTNWAGGVVSNHAKLTFLMQSNLTLQANFADVTKPTVTIISPTANLKADNVMFTATGRASDNVRVSNVFYSLNGFGLGNSDDCQPLDQLDGKRDIIAGSQHDQSLCDQHQWPGIVDE